jgi:enoyl-CoA hydratase
VYENYETLEITRDGKILTVSFNRPEVKNATNPRMHMELRRIFPEIATDEQTNVVIITGKGTSFSAGGDLLTLQRSLDDHSRWMESMVEARAILTSLIDLDRPVIDKINGHAMGLGTTLALMCDITVAKDTAIIADTHVKVGLTAGDGGAVIWPMLVGIARAKKYLLTAEPISGADAAAIGLISEAVTAERLDARVAEIALRLVALPAVALRTTKKAINMALRQQLDALLEAHLGYETMSHLSADHREAVAAFVAKRAPVFTGN